MVILAALSLQRLTAVEAGSAAIITAHLQPSMPERWCISSTFPGYSTECCQTKQQPGRWICRLCEMPSGVHTGWFCATDLLCKDDTFYRESLVTITQGILYFL